MWAQDSSWLEDLLPSYNTYFPGLGHFLVLPVTLPCTLGEGLVQSLALPIPLSCSLGGPLVHYLAILTPLTYILGFGLVHAAAEGGDVSIMQYLQSCGCDIHARSTPGGQTALHVAARLGHVHLVEWLVEEGVSAEERDAEGLTALDCAWMAEQTVVLNVLAFH